MAARKRRRRRKPAPDAQETVQPTDPEARPIINPEYAAERSRGGAAPGAPPAAPPAIAIGTFYQHIAGPLSQVLSSSAVFATQMSGQSLELDTRLGHLISALTATHSHIGVCLASLQEMQEQELE